MDLSLSLSLSLYIYIFIMDLRISEKTTFQSTLWGNAFTIQSAHINCSLPYHQQASTTSPSKFSWFVFKAKNHKLILSVQVAKTQIFQLHELIQAILGALHSPSLILWFLQMEPPPQKWGLHWSQPFLFPASLPRAISGWCHWRRSTLCEKGNLNGKPMNW